LDELFEVENEKQNLLKKQWMILLKARVDPLNRMALYFPDTVGIGICFGE
jgi:hypothetical protein